VVSAGLHRELVYPAVARTCPRSRAVPVKAPDASLSGRRGMRSWHGQRGSTGGTIPRPECPAGTLGCLIPHGQLWGGWGIFWVQVRPPSWRGTPLIPWKPVSPSGMRGGDSVRPWVVDQPAAAAGENRRPFATGHRRPSEEKSSHADRQIQGVYKPSLRGFRMFGV
jgi:hypothetical protein